MTHFPIHNSELWLVCIIFCVHQEHTNKKTNKKNYRYPVHGHRHKNHQYLELYNNNAALWQCLLAISIEKISTNFLIIAEDESADYLRSVSLLILYRESIQI
jgi:hypothetical protein